MGDRQSPVCVGRRHVEDVAGRRRPQGARRDLLCLGHLVGPPGRRRRERALGAGPWTRGLQVGGRRAEDPQQLAEDFDDLHLQESVELLGGHRARQRFGEPWAAALLFRGRQAARGRLLAMARRRWQGLGAQPRADGCRDNLDQQADDAGTAERREQRQAARSAVGWRRPHASAGSGDGQLPADERRLLELVLQVGGLGDACRVLRSFRGDGEDVAQRRGVLRGGDATRGRPHVFQEGLPLVQRSGAHH
mmetsp:Transcript_29338/g.83457  ORF Transcript_29338/g.83457 Transcript_29338/m.83457 type:complete len:249 (-) Transcript_29338:440-1186(-)